MTALNSSINTEIDNGKEVKINHFCKCCNAETSHFQIVLQKPSEHKQNKVKEFLSGFFHGLFAGPALASLELLDRHLICERCGTREVVNGGDELK